MMEIPYRTAVAGISLVWLAVRGISWVRQKKICLRRELELLVVYICLIVVARFTFFPFGKVDGHIQPLLFDAAAMWPPRYNLKPVIYLTDYSHRRYLAGCFSQAGSPMEDHRRRRGLLAVHRNSADSLFRPCVGCRRPYPQLAGLFDGLRRVFTGQENEKSQGVKPWLFLVQIQRFGMMPSRRRSSVPVLTMLWPSN